MDSFLSDFIVDVVPDANARLALLLVLCGVAACALLFLFFVFSFFEHALFSLSKQELEKINQSEAREFKILKKMLKAPEKSMATVLTGHFLWAILICVSVCMAGVCCFSEFPAVAVFIASAFVAVLLLTLFGELIPIKLKDSDKKLKYLYSYSKIINSFSKIFSPVATLLMKATTVVRRRLDLKSHHVISIDELSETLSLSEVQEKEEKGILQGIVEFGNISADEIMKPRVDVVDLDSKTNYEEVLALIRDTEYSRLPVYEGSIDNVKGVLYIKDLLRYLDEDKDFEWQKLIRPAYFVPETKKIDDLLKEFQSKHIHMAIVVDEFGGTSGIVTLEDILEVIVGDICDEHDDEQKLYTVLDSRNFLLEGKLALTDFFKIDKIEKEVFAEVEADADTLAGLILEIKGAIPVVGEKIEYNGYVFQIVSADSRRIKKVKLQIPEGYEN